VRDAGQAAVLPLRWFAFFVARAASNRGGEDKGVKISSTECGNAVASAASAKKQEKILPKEMPRTKARDRAAQVHLTPLEQGIAVAEEALKQIPDVREDVVEDLRRRIESGEYQVSGEDVADMMMRRRAADRLR
jgi:negative regulator of flagellin synthesis FlgM